MTFEYPKYRKNFSARAGGKTSPDRFCLERYFSSVVRLENFSTAIFAF
jgi:hypothetical protein